MLASMSLQHLSLHLSTHSFIQYVHLLDSFCQFVNAGHGSSKCLRSCSLEAEIDVGILSKPFNPEGML